MAIRKDAAIGGGLVFEVINPVIDDLTTVYDPLLGAYVRRDLGGNDVLNGTINGDVIHAYDGDDVVNAGGGNDTMIDKGNLRPPVAGMTYRSASVTAASNWDGSDNDVFNGGNGNDTLLAGAGNNTFNGGDGNDTVSYALSSKGAIVDLAAGFGQGVGYETLNSVENVIGSEQADFLLGDDAGNQLWGRGGNDILIGRGGGDWLVGDAGDDTLDGGAGPDILSGGAGIDTTTYQSSSAGVIVSLAQGRGWLGDAEGDIIQNVENVTGSNFNDVLVGDGLANKLVGNGGNDILNGEGGADRLWGGDGHDTLDGGAGNDELVGGAGDDLLIGGAGQDSMWGGAGADTFRYTSLSDFDNLEIINDFEKGVDKIDLSQIDANPGRSGNQAFVFDFKDGWAEEAADALNDLFGAMTGNGPIHNGDPGEVTYRHQDGDTWIFVQMSDGDMYAQFRIKGIVELSASDFIL